MRYGATMPCPARNQLIRQSDRGRRAAELGSGDSRLRPMLPPAGSGGCVPCTAGPTRRWSTEGEAFCQGISEVIQPCVPGNLKTGEGNWRGDIANAGWRPLDRLLAGLTVAPGERGLLKTQKRRDTPSPTQEHRASSLFILLRVSAVPFNSVC